MMDVKDAIAHFERYLDNEFYTDKYKAACKMAIDALRAQQAAEKNDPVHAVGVCYCKECKHWHEGTGFCDKNSYFVDAVGESCSPAKSREWTMFDADDFCSKAERRKNNAKIN